jgi:hypothetical protein
VIPPAHDLDLAPDPFSARGVIDRDQDQDQEQEQEQEQDLQLIA